MNVIMISITIIRGFIKQKAPINMKEKNWMEERERRDKKK
jgi:hypothetical protein